MSLVLSTFLLPPASPLQKLLYNQAILTGLKETVDMEIFDRSTVLTEIYSFHELVPLHLIYFAGLGWILYKHRDSFFSDDSTFVKSAALVRDLPRVKRLTRSALFVFLFLFTKNVESAI